MAFTADDLAKIEQAIATGTMRVRFGDGREVTYQSLGELMKARESIAGLIAASSPSATARLSRVIFNPGRC